MQSTYPGHETVLSMIEDGIVQVSFQLDLEVSRVKELLARYQPVLISLADAWSDCQNYTLTV
jgi:hypothetical protein